MVALIVLVAEGCLDLGGLRDTEVYLVEVQLDADGEDVSRIEWIARDGEPGEEGAPRAGDGAPLVWVLDHEGELIRELELDSVTSSVPEELRLLINEGLRGSSEAISSCLRYFQGRGEAMRATIARSSAEAARPDTWSCNRKLESDSAAGVGQLQSEDHLSGSRITLGAQLERDSARASSG